MRHSGRIRAATLAAALFLIAPAQAQDRMVVPSPVLTINQEALFERSAFGQRVLTELEAASQALAAENRTIEAELSEEERRLTDERAGMDPAAFRELAAAFDVKVVELRRQQDQKERAITQRPDEARQEFLRAAVPILAELVRERGAVAILDTRAVILSADIIDITEEAIRRIDAVLGDGAQMPAPETPQPQAVPEPEAPQTQP